MTKVLVARMARAAAIAAMAVALGTTVTAAPAARPRTEASAAAVLTPYRASGTGSPGAALIARFEGFRGSAVSQFRGYVLRVRGNGAWQIVANGPAAVLLASGSVAAARAYALSLTTRGITISAQINGVPVATVTNRMYRYGPAGLGSLGYYPVRYPGFTIGHRPGDRPS